jgi:tagatose 6-phosphate kinase
MILCVGLSPALQRTLLFGSPVGLGEVNRAEQTILTASGKAVNVARMATALGTPVRLVQPLGGPTGQFHAQLAERDGIQQVVVGVAPLTRICTTLLAGGVVTELVEECGPLPPDALKALFDASLSQLDEAQALCLSGSLPPGCPEDFYAALVRAARERNKPTLIDFQGMPLKLALTERPWLVKINRAEAATTLGLPGSTDSATLCGLLLQAGAEHSIVTDGAAGAMLAESSGALWHLNSPEGLDVLNPIGSGDAMNAGILTGIGQGRTLPGATRFGVACAAANCRTATSGVLDPAAVPVLLAGVSITPIRLADPSAR